MKKLLKFVIVLGLVFGGWALAAASLHVVRAPGTMIHGYVPLNVQLVTKNALTFRDTYVDTTKWSLADVDAHKDFVSRLEQLNKLELVKQAMGTPSAGDAHASAAPAGSAAAVEKAAPQPAPTDKGSKSIFDFNR